MTITLNVTGVSLGSSSAPLIEGATPSTFGTAGGGVGFSNAATTGRIGCRVALSSASDFTTHDFIGFQFYASAPYNLSGVDTVANGGRRIIFVDGSGNYAGFNIYGSGIPNYTDGTGNAGEGFWTTYNNISSINPLATAWMISPSKTPDISSGTIDWTNIVALEITVNLTSSHAVNLYIGALCKHSGVSITGTETIASIRGGISSTYDPQFVTRSPYSLQSNPQLAYSYKTKLLVGNGSTTTNWTESNFSLGFLSTYDKSPTYRSVGPIVQLDTSNTRLLKINQSASDTLALTDFTIASAAWWQWELTGSGSATLTRGQFWRFNSFIAGHGTYTDCAWNGGEAAVTATSSTVITRGTIRDGVGHGLKITTGAGIYSSLDIDFDDNSTYDIELGSGGAGTYELTAIAVIGSYTLKIRNDSATNAITVAIPSGITYSTSTAGGTISVTTPALYQSVAITGATAGSRIQIYDTDSSTELYNGTPTFPYTWTDSVAAAADRAIRIRLSYVSGATAKDFIEASIGTCGQTEGTKALTYLVTQTNETTYNTNAIDGPAIYATSGITFTDSGTDLVNCNIAGGSVTYATMYACFVHWMNTATGIADDIAYIDAPDTANYLLTSMKIRNTSATDLTVTGGWGRDATTGLSKDIIDTAGSTGNIFLAPDHVIPYSVGSGLTAGQAAELTSAASAAATAASQTASLTFTGTSVHADIIKVSGTTVDGAGTEVDPWGPV